jgi:hypothetical protein
MRAGRVSRVVEHRDPVTGHRSSRSLGARRIGDHPLVATWGNHVALTSIDAHDAAGARVPQVERCERGLPTVIPTQRAQGVAHQRVAAFSARMSAMTAPLSYVASQLSPANSR